MREQPTIGTPARERAVPPPQESHLAAQYVGANLVDAFAIVLPSQVTLDIGLLTRAVLASPAPWMTALMKVRDRIVTIFGVQTSGELRRRAAADGVERVNFFRIMGRWESEMVVGDDDTHLDFRVSVLLRSDPAGAGQELVTTTVVHCHNFLGRAYLTAIMPFHKAIVRSNLRRASARGWPMRPRVS